MNTTLNKIKENSPCQDGWEKLLKSLNKTKADDNPLPFKTILESNGIMDAVWCLRTLPFTDQAEFRAEIAKSVLPIFEAKYPQDDRPRKAIEAIRKFQKGEISETEINLATAAYAAYAAAEAAATAAYAAAYAAYAAEAVYATVAYAAAFHAAAADVAADAVYAAATARKNKWREIEDLFRKHFC